MNLVEVHNLTKSFKRHFWSETKKVIDELSFDIPSGVITGFLGANGAGKTTTMKCVLGLIFPDSGDITYFGKKSLTTEIKKKIGFLPEQPYFYSYLTGVEFLKFYGEISTKLTRRDLLLRIDYLLKKVDLYHAKDKALRQYSKGMLQKIGFAQALIHEPELLILDEPLSGLDPDGRHYLNELIKETAKEGRSVFFSSHLLHDTEKLCENLVILKDGRLFYQGPTRNILDNLNAKYRISFLRGHQQETIFVNNQDEIQSHLKDLLSQDCIIEEVEQDRITLEEYFVKNVLEKKMKPVWIIAKNTYREIIRDRIIYALFVFAIIMVGAALALGQLSFSEQARISANFGMAAIHISAIIIAIFVGSSLVSKEIDKKTILSILTRPLSRLQFLLGKSLGLILIILTVIVGLSFIQAFVFWGLKVPITPAFFVSIYGILLESLVLLGIALMFSTFSSSFLVVSFTIGIFLIGHWVENLNFLAKKSSSELFSIFAKLSVYGFPNLEKFNWRDVVLYNDDLRLDEIVMSTLYGLGWWILFLFLTMMFFRKKDFA